MKSFYSPVQKGIVKSLPKNFPFGVGGAAFSPGSLSGLTQRFLDQTPTYYGSVNSYPVLTPEESGTVAQPRGQRCALFDGTDDYATLGARVTSGTITALTVSAWIKTTNAGLQVITGEWYASNQSWLFYMSGGNLLLSLSSNGTNLYTFTTTATVNSGSWVHVAFTYNATTPVLYINGSVASGTPSGSIPSSLFNSSSNFRISTNDAVPSNYLNGSVRDARVFSSAKSAGEIAAIYNQASTPSTIDTNGLLGMWSLQEESGTTAYDSSGNGKHLTLTNITQGTFHATDSGVTWNPSNWKGHTVSGSVIIPQNLASPTLDAAGNALGVAGPVAHPATMEVPCITGDGSAVYADLGVLIPATADFNLSLWYYHPANDIRGLFGVRDDFSAGKFAVYSTNSPSNLLVMQTPSSTVNSGTTLNVAAWNYVTASRVGTTFSIGINGVSANVTDAVSVSQVSLKLLTVLAGYYATGRISDFRVTTAGVTKRFPLQEGPGTGSTNRDLYMVASDGTSNTLSGAILNGTVATIWANRCPYAQDHFINYGGRVASGVAIPGRLTGSLAADGNALTHAAGNHGNPYSRLCPNTWSAPELVNIGSTSSTKLAPTDTVQSTSPVDTKFRRTKTDGDDRYFAVLTALTGTDKTNAEAYVA